MKCPFCKARLQVWQEMFHTTYGCNQIGCVVDDMPRYQITFNNYPTYLLSKTFILDKYYIQIDYPNNKTTVSKLVACFLIDTIQLERCLAVNFNNPQDLINKINTLLIFS
jgi:hypothetical protein